VLIVTKNHSLIRECYHCEWMFSPVDLEKPT
jgi:hypothetical protein